jgi:hypothetical protein
LEVEGDCDSDTEGVGGDREGVGGDREGVGGDREGVGGDREGVGIEAESDDEAVWCDFDGDDDWDVDTL